MIGKRFERWLVLEEAPKRAQHRYFVCRCDCGVTKQVLGSHLVRGNTRSCGCLHSEKASARLKKHGLTKTKTHNAWCAIRQRCLDKNTEHYNRYGGRGIKICDRWLESFENFLEDMGIAPAGHSIERIDNDGNYEPNNCRWASKIEQMNNMSTNRVLEFNGRRLTCAQWDRELNYTVGTVRQRLAIGWSIEKALTQKLRTHPAQKQSHCVLPPSKYNRHCFEKSCLDALN